MKHILITLVAAIFLFMGCSKTTDEKEKELQLEFRKTPLNSLSNGDIVKVELWVSNASDVFGLASIISYDSNFLIFTEDDFQIGDFWNGNATYEYLIVEDDLIQSSISLLNSEKMSGLNGNGMIFELTFMVNTLETVNTEIIFTNGYIINADGDLQDDYVLPANLELTIVNENEK